MPGTILLMDNQVDVLDKWGSLLQETGYCVLKAPSLEEAESILNHKRVHLAILDSRMVDDDDQNDISGLLLAKKSKFASVPKIILTAYKSFEYARMVLAPDAEGQTPAVNFIAKDEGPQILLETVKWAFDNRVRINWDLKFTSHEDRAFDGMSVCVLGSNLSEDELDDRSQELEDLFRKLLYDYDEVNLEIVPTKRQGQALTWVRLRKEGKEVPARLIRCGRREGTLAEQHAYGDVDRGQLVNSWAVRQENVETSVHFGVIECSSVGFDLGRSRWLADYCRLLTVEETRLALDNWFDKAWTSLYGQECVSEENLTLNRLYRERLGLIEGGGSGKEFWHSLGETVIYVQSHYMGRLVVDDERRRLALSFPDGEQLSCPDPALYIYEDAKLFEPPVSRRLSLGCMDGYTIIIDQDGKAWVTEFGTIGPAPALSDFVELEARIRFEWIRTVDLDWSQLREFESVLTAPTSLEDPLHGGRVANGDLGEALAVIAHLRALAARVPGAHPQEYQLGLLFHAARILFDDAPLDRKAHALLAAAMICRSLEQWEQLEAV